MQLPNLGDIFDGRYRIDGLLGEGGFATVFTAEEIGVGRQVALKVLKPDAEGYDSDVTRRFQRELAALATLRSPHTVTMYTYGASSTGLLYVVFEHLKGRELAELLRERGRLDGPEVEHILRQLLDSLGEAHQHGLLHRDLKPENIIVLADDRDPLRIKLIDFGIARSLDAASPSITRTGELIGTPRYMSPEQLTEKPLTAASDLYSLGLIAFEMAMGRDALHGGSWGDQLERLMTGHVFSVPELERLGPGLVMVITKMSARRPEARFQSAAAVLSALDGPPVSQPSPIPAPTAPPSPAVPDRRPWLWASAVFGLVVVVGLLGVVFVPKDDVPRATVDRTREIGIIRPPTKTPTVDRDEGSVRATTDAGQIPREPDETSWQSFGCGNRGPVKQHDDVFVPPSYQPGVPSPLLVLFHDGLTDPVHFLNKSGFGEIAEREGFVVIAPLSPRGLDGNSPWLSGTAYKVLGREDPIESAVRRVDLAHQEYCIDTRRVFAVGHGAGGHGADKLFCRRPLAGIATVSHIGDGPRCDVIRGSVARFTPTQSDHHAIFGGDGCGDAPATTRTVNLVDAEWARALRCTPRDPEFEEVRTRPQQRTWDCPEGAFESRLIVGGHPWPGVKRDPNYKAAHCDGEAPTFDYPEAIWTFFESVPDRD